MRFVLSQYIPDDARAATDIVDHVERLVIGGLVQGGDRLPPIRELADATGLAPNTVAAAYRSLARRGTVVGRGRHGTFVADTVVPPQPDPEIPLGLIDLGSGNPDPSLLPDLNEYLPGLRVPRVMYGDPPVAPIIEGPARKIFEQSGIPAREFAVVHGALDGVERSLQAHLRAGDRVAIEAPGWPAFSSLVHAMGMRPVPVRVDDRGMIPDRLAAVAGDVQAVVVTPRFQNPTGAVIDEERSGQISRVLEPYPDVLVVEDDHAGLISGAPLFSIGAGRPRWVYVASVSKSLGPDLRLAFLAGDDRTVKHVLGRQSAGPGWVSHVMQALVATILDDPRTEPLLDRAIEAYAARRIGLMSGLSERGMPAMGSTGLNVWVPVPDEQAVVAALAAAGFAVRAGERWRLGTPQAVRIAIGGFELWMVDPVCDAIAGATDGHRTRGA